MDTIESCYTGVLTMCTQSFSIGVLALCPRDCYTGALTMVTGASPLT